jgi:ABC-2 type transport system ATP-binding protein
MTFAIEAEGLVKRFKKTLAVDGVDLAVRPGMVLGLLGPNGAGKTTVVRMLATLLRPDAGYARVCGADVVHQADRVRELIGLTGQYAAVDEDLTGFENLLLIGRLLEIPRAEARRRSAELLERFELAEAGGRSVKTYSGGMRRRLDIAASLIARPAVVFLDEPTTGLDPRSRLSMWEFIEDLVSDGTTILLTTQYLEEADRLAGSMVVIDHGKVIARGTADELKSQVGGQRLEFTVVHETDLQPVADQLRELATEPPRIDRGTRTVTAPVTGGPETLARALALLEPTGIELGDVGLRRPDLDDVFLTLTGHIAEDEDAAAADPKTKKAGASR